MNWPTGEAVACRPGISAKRGQMTAARSSTAINGVRATGGRVVRGVARRLIRILERVAGLPAGAAVVPAKPPNLMQTIVSDAVSQADVLHFCRQFAPRDVEGFAKIRLGNQYDGGYVFIDDFSEISTVISCGISNDVTCDVALADMGMTVLQFDHTVEGPPVQHPKFLFRKQAIDAFGIIPGSVRLWDVVRAEGDPSKSDILLKIDIDGDEWATFANHPVDQLKRFRQIACEFHWSSRMKDPEYFRQCLRAIENLRKAFFPVHLHANNFVGFSSLMGVPVPEVFEVTFVNSALYRPGQQQHGAPTQFDNPNNPDAPDLFLGSPFGIA
jgi:hypothetical protein